MYDWQSFDVVFQAKPDYAYESKAVNTILKHRDELGGALFFDRVWSTLGLKDVTKSYPPKTNRDIRNLWQTVVKSASPDHQKHAILYYILKDCRHLNDAEAHFSRKVWLQEKYRLLVSGLWELDHCRFSTALEYLTEPSLIPTFPDEILYTLISHPKCDKGLAMAYYITILPPLQDARSLKAYFTLLCQNSVAEAYHFCQRQEASKHKSLLEDLVVGVHSEPGSEARAERALTLVSLPFTEEEEAWFEECLLYGRGARCNQAKDSVIMRRIAMGKSYEGLGALDRLRGQKKDGLSWDDVRSSIQKTGIV